VYLKLKADQTLPIYTTRNEASNSKEVPMPETHPFGRTVASTARLRELIPEPSQLVLRKVVNRIDDHVRRFIALCPYVVIATASRERVCDSSPRGGDPGFIRVIDDHHILIPEVTGNRRADSISNLLGNPSIGMLFMIPGFDETLRVNGRVFITEDEEILKPSAKDGKVPLIGLGIRVEECYIHCAKPAMRSTLWNPVGWPDISDLPSAAEILRDHTGGTEGDGSVEYMQDVLSESYTKRMY
jgi:PPOX class probable FMN-dependent enzyme